MMLEQSCVLDTIEALELIHYGGTVEDPNSHAAISFWTKPQEVGKPWLNIGGICAHELRDTWPALSGIQRDAYFSINSVFPNNKARPSELTGLPAFTRRTASLRWINALWVDIDRHKPPFLPFAELVGLFEQARIAAGLPVPALHVSSGRGFWALWRLCSHADRIRPVRAMPDQVAVWKRIAQALVEKFRDVVAEAGCELDDACMTNAASLTRIPNSLNSDAPEERARVRWFPQNPQATYSLPEMAAILGVRSEKTSVGAGEEKNPKRQAAGRRRPELAWAGFTRLLEMRAGTMPPNARRNGIAIAATLLKRLRHEDASIYAKCHEFARRWGVTACEVKRRVEYGISQGQRPYSQWMNTDDICRFLHVTSAERVQIPEWKTRPRHVTKVPALQRSHEREKRVAAIADRLAAQPTASQHELAAEFGVSQATISRAICLIRCTPTLNRGDAPLLLGRDEYRETVSPERRRTLVAAELENAGDVSVRKLARRLREKYNIPASPATIARDLQANRSQQQDYDLDEAIDSHYIRCLNGDLMRRKLWDGEGIPEHGPRIIRSKRDDATINAVA